MTPSVVTGCRADASVVLRALGAPDASALGALFDSLSPGDRRRRFHGAVNGLPPAWLLKLVEVDQRSHVAIGLVDAGADRDALIAEARWAMDDGGAAAEFAITVAPTWRRCGLGQRCMQELVRAARRRGLTRLYGTVQADNEPMLALARRCGFTCTPIPGDASMVRVEAGLARMQDLVGR